MSITTTETTERDLELKLEKELECSFCRDLFREPKTLGCLHSFCLECLEIYVEKNHSNIELRCPICRTPFQLESKEQLRNLSIDSFLLNNLNIHNSLKNSSEQDQKKKKKLKLVCVDGENEATTYCLDCQEYLCGGCTIAHKSMRISKNHQLILTHEMKNKVGINSISNLNPQIYCQIHQQEEMKLFCDDCKIPICPLCVEKHPSHKILTLSNIIEVEKESLIDLINKVRLSIFFPSFHPK